MRKRTCLPAIGVLLATFSIAAAGPVTAGVSVVAESESLTGSSTISTGFFDVYLTVTGTGNPNLQGWQTRVNLDPSSATGMTFGVPTVTSLSPIRAMALGTDTGFTTPIGLSVSNSATQASAEQDIAGSVSLDSLVGAGAGLMRVPFTLAAGAHGTYTLDLSADPTNGTLLVSNAPAIINYTPVNGTITVSSVPEPAMIGMGLMSLCGIAFRRHRKIA